MSTSLSVSADVDDVMDRLRGLVQSAARKGVDFRESFEHFDTNRDGEIDEREFRDGLERLGFELTRSEVGEIMDAFTTGSGSGRIKYRDFIRAIQPSEEGKLDEEITALVAR